MKLIVPFSSLWTLQFCFSNCNHYGGKLKAVHSCMHAFVRGREMILWPKE
uniref:Uncharacterized protein n=1 Tax=Rhizophora mucronata TaxID=61149 RepID=A0A2P2R388_RHIMU